MSARSFLSTALASSAALLAGLVSAGNAVAAPSLAELPLADLPAVPTNPPKSVPKGGDAAVLVMPTNNGTVLVIHKESGASPHIPQITAADRARLTTTPGVSACVGWSQQAVSAFRQSVLYMNKEQSVMAVRTEVLEERPDGASLKVSDYWVDPKTGGAQAIGAPVSIPLLRVTSAKDAAIYAFRTEKAGPPRAPAPANADADVKAEAAKPPEKERTVVLVAGAVQGANFQASSGRNMSSQCDVAFAEIDVKDGSGTVQGQFNKMLTIEETRQKSPDAPPSTMPFQRALHVSASVSQTSRDPSPLFSISTRWLTELPPQFKVQKL